MSTLRLGLHSNEIRDIKMIIDFHTHTFPKEIAIKALDKLAKSEGLNPFTDGTNEGLIASMKESGVDISVLLPVVTKAVQAESINKIALENNLKYEGKLISFGGIHPDNEDYAEILKGLKEGGIKGIKLHPIFQKTYFDDIKYKRIIDRACELGLIILVHTGYDVSCSNAPYVTKKQIIPVMKELKPEKCILAHMGSWREWEEAEEVIGECTSVCRNDCKDTGKGIWIDTSFALSPDGKETFYDTPIPTMDHDRFKRIIRMTGTDRVLFGTDSPWTGQAESIEAIRRCGLDKETESMILGENAAGLLEL